MKILYVHQYFKTPEEGGCIRSYHLSKGLSAAGHQVVVITAHNQRYKQKNISGLEVHYLPVSYSNKMGFLSRAYSYLRFVFLTRSLMRRLEHQFDLAYVMTTPLTTGLIALHLKEVYNIPYFFEVGDLWPEAPIKMGAINNRFLKSYLYKFEKKCYFNAQKVIALSPAIRNYIEANCPETNVHVLTNIADTSFFEPDYHLQSFSEEFPLLIGYFGTFGAANHLEYLINAARSCLKAGLPVKFTLMGEGARFSSIKKISQNLTNVKVLPFGNTYQVREEISKQHAVYASFKNLEILNTGSPNKFFDGLAAGKLIVINFGGWINTLIEKHRCGFYHDPEVPEEFVRKMRVFVSDPQMLITYQKNARKLGENFYSRSLQISKLQKMLSNEKHLNISDSEVYILTA